MDQPSYYSILTADVRYNKDLSFGEKVFYSEITALSNKYGFCTASNKYFTKLYDLTPQTISRWLANLEKYGFIKREVIRDKDNVVIERKIYPISNVGEVSTKIIRPSQEKCELPPIKNVKENNTSNNTTSINNICATDVDAGVQGKSDKSSRPPKSTRDLEAEFNELWAIYPNKKGKKQAFNHYKAWAKKSTQNTKEVMESKLKGFISYLQYRHTEPRYIPYGSTWFNGGYDDDYSTPKLPPTEPEGFGAPESHAIDQGNPNILDIPDDELPF